jgi:hypothetical protein
MPPLQLMLVAKNDSNFLGLVVTVLVEEQP